LIYPFPVFAAVLPVQLAFTIWFYQEGEPGQKELWLFAIMML